jgi:uncharacterized protein Smg (DUF494 family)
MEFLLTWLTAYWWLIFFFLLIFGGGIWGAVRYLFRQWNQTRRKDQENNLKRDMIAKGFSPADIEQVLHASALADNDDSDDSTDVVPKGPLHGTHAKGPGFDKARLVKKLVDCEWEAKDIERVLHALAEYLDDELPGKVAAIESMADTGMGAEDVERVIRAFDRPAPPAGVSPGKAETSFRE